MTDLATRIETEPPSRELADEVLLALGYRRKAFGKGFLWNLPPEQDWFGACPNPLTSETDAFAMLGEAQPYTSIEIEAGTVSVFFCDLDNVEKTLDASHVRDGPHKVARAITAALIRAKEGEHD